MCPSLWISHPYSQFFSHIVISNTQQNTFKCTLSVTLRPFKAYCTGPSLSPQPGHRRARSGTIAH
uniref:Uncharacterized protein n=1 Tax=Anguilla anguilla TaxID=7936 RepID=A0A0E9VMS7_ANGAN